jgi:uncharacterized protein (TIGR02118 family)
MYTIIFSTYKNDSVSKQEMVDRWTGRHAEIARNLPKLRSYEILVVNETVEADEPAPDGFVVLRFDNKEDCDAALASEVMAEAVADTEGLFRKFTTYVVDRHAVVDELSAA